MRASTVAKNIILCNLCEPFVVLELVDFLCALTKRTLIATPYVLCIFPSLLALSIRKLPHIYHKTKTDYYNSH